MAQRKEMTFSKGVNASSSRRPRTRSSTDKASNDLVQPHGKSVLCEVSYDDDDKDTEDVLAAAHDTNERLEIKFAKLQATNDYLTSVNDALLTEKNELQHKNIITLGQLKDCLSKIKKAESQNSKLLEDFNALQESLETCKFELIKLQPPNRATDADIVECFQELSKSVSDWIAACFNFFDDIDKQDRSVSASRPCNVDNYVKGLCSEFTGASEFFLYHKIFRFLTREILLDSRPLVGLPDEAVKTYEHIKQGLLETASKRGSNDAHLEFWQSETLNGMEVAAVYKITRTKASWHLSRRLLTEIHAAFPAIESFKQCHEQLFDNIICPAVQLGNLIAKTLPGKYKILANVESMDFGLGPSLTKSSMLKCLVKDLQSRRTMLDNTWAHFRDEETVGVLIAIIEPGLILLGEVAKVVRKPVIVIKRVEQKKVDNMPNSM